MDNTPSDNFFRRLKTWATRGLLISFWALIFLPFGPRQALAQTPRNYVVQFSSAPTSVQLAQLGSKAARLFGFSTAPQFASTYSFSSALTEADLKAQLGGNLNFLEPKQSYAAAQIVLNDPGFTLNSQDVDKQWGLVKAGFINAWEKSVGTGDNTVAVIDTGVDETHEDLQSINFVPGFNFITSQSILPRVNSDDNGHGTLVTGILGATSNNSIGVVGTNWKISVMPIKALDENGKGDTATIAQALVWATDHGAQIINLSFGGIGLGHDTALNNAVAYAYNHNVIIVAAAGNDVSVTGGNLDLNPVYPICSDNDQNMVLGVVATDQNDQLASFSNFGKNCVDVSAPGKRILSTINYDPLTKILTPNSYAYASGTSLAAPFVSGLAALLRTVNPKASNAQIRDKIISTADPIDVLNLNRCDGGPCTGLLGAGRINAQTALAQPIPVQPTVVEGDLVQVNAQGAFYLISGGQKRQVSRFVFDQRFTGHPIKIVSSQDLNNFTTGPFATPLEGTLVKYANSPTVYQISQGEKWPITYQVFQQRKLNFGAVFLLTDEELNSWTTASFLPFSEGTLVRTAKSRALYWVVGQSLHWVNWNFYRDRGLSIFPIFTVPDKDLAGFPKGEDYTR